MIMVIWNDKASTLRARRAAVLVVPVVATTFEKLITGYVRRNYSCLVVRWNETTSSLDVIDEYDEIVCKISRHDIEPLEPCVKKILQMVGAKIEDGMESKQANCS